jgi:hypothetical protein
MIQVDLLHVSPERFRASPQRGLACVMPWDALATYLSRPTFGPAKDVAGGYAIGRYADDVRRKANLERTGALVIDVDEGGDVARVAEAVGRYLAIVHETFSSTPEAPRCRLLLALAAPIDATTYEATHKIVRARLSAAGIIADEGAKDASRLSYSPVRRPGTGFAFAANDGAPLDARAVLAAAPPAPPRSPPRVVAPKHADRYVQGALRRAASSVANATPGGRHHELGRQAFGLARLAVPEHEIRAALLDPFVAAAGEGRRHEGERTIGDAVRARRGAA